MPIRETLDIRVTLTIEVDGHRLTFTATEKASGARYHGKRPPEPFVGTELERAIRVLTDLRVANCAERASAFLARTYPFDEGP